MVQIICGEKGKGKTKYLLEKANNAVRSATGDVIYVDKSTKHMYELDSKIRLINMCDYPITTSESFFGFLSGILSQDNDIEVFYLDSFLTLASISENDGLASILEKLEKLSESFKVNFVLSVSKNEKDLPEIAKGKIIISL